jgi:hypothetical protein
MSDVRPVGTVEEKGFAAPAPCKIEALLESIARGAIVEGVNDVDGAIDDGRGMKEVFVFIIWRPYNSSLANIASWNK